ncbi:MAG TPA: hypothetical protein VK308_12410 [Pyrinomonadaceae bacterium]|nr:hypothetical protein [Pyrinomonadaceae bacterium]
MAVEKIEKLTRKQRLEEIAAMDCFLSFADPLLKSVWSVRKFQLDSVQQKALRLVYNRLAREMKRRASGGRPPAVSDATIDLIAAQIEFKGKEWRVKDEVRKEGIKSIAKLCEKHATTYKKFWRRWQKREAEENEISPLEESLRKIEVLRRLSNAETAKGKQDCNNLAEVIETVKNFPARLRAKNSVKIEKKNFLRSEESGKKKTGKSAPA